MREPVSPARPPSPRERERTVVTGVGVLLLLLWLGFVVHRSPRFPGSLAGTVLAAAGAALMTFPSLAYLAVKRFERVKLWITPRIPLQRLLAWHVYGGLAGAVLATLHTGHRFDSTLGIALTGTMFLSVFSGYIGRHFLGHLSLELRDKQQLLGELVTTYNRMAAEMAVRPLRNATATLTSARWSRVRRRVLGASPTTDDELFERAYRAAEVASSIADLEYSIKGHELLKRRFRVWLTVHIITSVAFYSLLTLHIWAAFYFGLRWLV